MKRLKDYTFVEFEIDISKAPLEDSIEEVATIKAKVWFSFTNKEAFVTESLGQTLSDSIRQNIEIDIFNIEDIIIYGFGSVYNDFDEVETLETYIEQEVKKDYTKYFSLDNT